MHNWVIIAICIHIAAGNKVPGYKQRIRAYEPAPFGVIIARTHIIQSALFIIIISAISERIEMSDPALNVKQVAVGVIQILALNAAG